MMTTTDTAILRLTGPERELVHAAVIASYTYDDLEQDLDFKLDRKLEDIVPPSNRREVAYRLLRTAEREGWLRDLLTMFANGKYPDVKEVAERTLRQHDSSPDTVAASGSGDAAFSTVATESHIATSISDISPMADPYLSQMIGGQRPFIDRSVLRRHFRDLLSDSTSRVLVVIGDRPCGKSYTWLFINQPELLAGFTPVLINLSQVKEPHSPMEVMSRIAEQLALGEPAIDLHAQQTAQARRLRDWLVVQLQQNNPDGRWLLVFDSLDHIGQREETVQLIEFLAGAAIREPLPGLRVILLGYANRLLIHPLESVLTEQVGDIGEPELREFFRLRAQHLRFTISDDAIDVAVHWVLSLLPEDRGPKLQKLPETVRKVSNTVFQPREVLQ
jgi:hypothetical protein